jgi:parallel beta-helix repeat protein
LNYVRIRYAGIGLLIDSSVQVTHNVFEFNSRGIYVDDYANPIITENEIRYSTNEAIYLEGNNTITIDNNIIDGNGYGLKWRDSSPIVTNNIITNNTYFPIMIIEESNPTITGNIIANNGIQAIYVSGDINQNTTWTNYQGLSLPYWTDGFEVTSGVTLTIPAGTVVKFDDEYSQVFVYGTLEVQSTPSNPVVFTSGRDDIYGGDTNGDGTLTQPQIGDWAAIMYYSPNILENTIIRYGGFRYDGLSYTRAAILAHAPVTITNCTFEYNRNGIHISSGSGDSIISYNGIYYSKESAIQAYIQNETPNVYSNSIEGNRYGMAVSANVHVIAENNWWGHLSGPYHASLNPSGQGDEITGDVDFDPWLITDPITSSVDLSVGEVTAIQVLDNQNLVKDKSTAVKVTINKTGRGTADNVSARMTYNNASYTSFYVYEAENFGDEHELLNDQRTYPLSFGNGSSTKTIFFLDNLAPSGNTFQATVTVDSLHAIEETKEDNNAKSSIVYKVAETKWGNVTPDLHIHYLRTDWDQSLTAYNDYVDATNKFMASVYPVAENRFTTSKSNWIEGDTSEFRGSDSLLDGNELALWALGTSIGLKLAHPTSDRFIATVPVHWFANNTKGLTNLVGISFGVGSTAENIANLPIVISEALYQVHPNGAPVGLHEVGHTYGLPQGLPSGCYEDYLSCNPNRKGEIGNYSASGLFVSERIPIETTTSRRIYAFMGSYSGVEYWVDKDDYVHLYDEHKASQTNKDSVNASSQVIMAAGYFNKNGSLTLKNWYILPESDLSPLTPGPYVFEYENTDGVILHQVSFDISFIAEGGVELEMSPFVLTIPYIPNTTKIVVKKNEINLAEKIVSSNIPTVELLTPNGGEQLSQKVTIEWVGSDNDGDTLSYSVFYSPDDGITWDTLISDTSEDNYTWEFGDLHSGTKYLIKVIVTDGINSEQDISNSAFTIKNDSKIIYLPLLTK